MICTNPDCRGHYDFDNIVHYAQKRFIEGCVTVALMAQAGCEREKEEIALVSLLDVEDDQIRDLELRGKYDKQCKVLDRRDRLRKLIQDKLAVQIPLVPRSFPSVK